LLQTGFWMPDRRVKARFIEHMLLQRAEKLPDGGLEARAEARLASIVFRAVHQRRRLLACDDTYQ